MESRTTEIPSFSNYIDAARRITTKIGLILIALLVIVRRLFDETTIFFMLTYVCFSLLEILIMVRLDFLQEKIQNKAHMDMFKNRCGF